MRRFARIHAIILVLLTLTGCSAARNGRDTLYQVSTLSALLEGVYDGETTFAELKPHGDFGIGTFNALDGEMICVDGHTYQASAAQNRQRQIPAQSFARWPQGHPSLG